MAAAAGELVRRPGLWSTAIATAVRLARPGWWHRRPFLPLPDDRLWHFRMETAYGRADAEPLVDDVVAYLEWCRTGARARHPGGAGSVARPAAGTAPESGRPGRGASGGPG